MPHFNDARALADRAGWILAGGRSTRMGSDKARLEIDGVPLALRIAGEIGKACSSVTLVGDPARYGILGLPVTPDNFPGEGPLAGIEAALGSTSSDWNLVVACDMPAVSAAIFESLFAVASAGTSDVALPRYEDGRLEPLCAVYHRRCHAVIRRALEGRVRRVTDVLQTLELTYITGAAPLAAEEPFANLNTPDDLRKYTNG